MKKIPLAAQLWPVRDECEKDFVGTLQQIAIMGYEGIEFAGFPQPSAQKIRQILDQLKLRCAGAHIAIEHLAENAFAKTVDWCATVGVSLIIVPGLPEKRINSVSAIRNTAEDFNRWAERLKASKMRIGFHNHVVDLNIIDGTSILEHFFINTSPDVLIQLDTGHIQRAGNEPAELIKHYGKRVVTVHLKEWTPDPAGAVIGKGKIEWQKVFDACEQVGVEWYIVEQETSPFPPMETAKLCRENLHKMGR